MLRQEPVHLGGRCGQEGGGELALGDAWLVRYDDGQQPQLVNLLNRRAGARQQDKLVRYWPANPPGQIRDCRPWR